MTNEELLEIESRLSKITPGKWTATEFDVHTDTPTGVWNTTQICPVTPAMGKNEECYQRINAEFIANAPGDERALIAEVRRVRLLVHQQEITGLGAVVLVAEIERLKAENSALKQSIAESKRIFEWYLDEAGIWCLHAFGAMASIYPNGTKWYWSVIGDMSGGGIVDTLENAFAEAYKKLREGGRVRPIDTIIRPEEPHQ